jgi:hypothetical protein
MSIGVLGEYDKSLRLFVMSLHISISGNTRTQNTQMEWQKPSHTAKTLYQKFETNTVLPEMIQRSLVPLFPFPTFMYQ